MAGSPSTSSRTRSAASTWGTSPASSSSRSWTSSWTDKGGPESGDEDQAGGGGDDPACPVVPSEETHCPRPSLAARGRITVAPHPTFTHGLLETGALVHDVEQRLAGDIATEVLT